MAYTFETMPAFLAAIREKPGMHTGGRSVTSLALLLTGFEMAEYQYAIPDSERLGGFDFAAFEAWVAARYNPKRLDAGSYHLAREAANSEEGGFLLWFEWYDDFRQVQPLATGAVG